MQKEIEKDEGPMPFMEFLSAMDKFHQIAFLADQGGYTWITQTLDDFGKNTELTKIAFGEDALDVVHGVAVGGPGGPALCFTGNAPLSPARAKFLCALIEHWPEFSRRLREHEIATTEKKG